MYNFVNVALFMAKIFVTYGNQAYYESLKRIESEVKGTGVFDKILIYTDNDLTSCITNHQLFRYLRGGGTGCGNLGLSCRLWHKQQRKI